MKRLATISLLMASGLFAAESQFSSPKVIKTSKDERSNEERTLWRADLKAYGWTKDERFFSFSSVSVMRDGNFVSVAFPSYKEMTSFPEPNPDKLRPQGRNSIVGWNAKGQLVLRIFRSPLPSFEGKDPLRHLVYLEVGTTKMRVVEVESEEGEWQRGDWRKMP